jgi:RNA 3'-terminal phosphate cyclase (ATP)
MKARQTTIDIDGSDGEGGGQILRSAITLALCTQRGFRIRNIRKNRAKPGLMRQHLMCLDAAREVSGSEIEGATLGSTEVTVSPKPVRSGSYSFALGGAGSTMLVLQTVLLPLARAGASSITLEGGTHNPMAPPFEFVQESYCHYLRMLGITCLMRRERVGFFPVGGGRVKVDVAQKYVDSPHLDLVENGALRRATARVLLAQVPRKVGERELRELKRFVPSLETTPQSIEHVDSVSPGNALLVSLEWERGVTVLSSLGERGVSAEVVAGRLGACARELIDSNVAVDENLADQLLLPLALHAGGTFRTVSLTPHFASQVKLLDAFLETKITSAQESQHIVRVQVDVARSESQGR